MKYSLVSLLAASASAYSSNDLTDFVTSQTSSLANHGCWCGKAFDNSGSAPGGTPVDAYDAACRNFAKCNRATSMKGKHKEVCASEGNPSWSLSSVTGACIGSPCEMAKCNCAKDFEAEISALFDSGESLESSVSCSPNGGGGAGDPNGVSKDAACKDATGNWEFYVQADQYCGDDGISESSSMSRVQRFVNDAPGVAVADVKWDSEFSDDGNSWSPQAGVTCVRRYYWSGVAFAGNDAWKHLVVYCYSDNYVPGNQVYLIHGHHAGSFDPTWPTYESRDNQAYAEEEVIIAGETSNLLDSAVRVALLGRLSVVVYDSPNLPFSFIQANGETLDVNPKAYMGTSFAVSAGTMQAVAQQYGGYVPDQMFHNWDVISVMARTIARILPLIENNMINDDLLTGSMKVVLSGASKRGWANILAAGSDLNNNIAGTSQIVSDFFKLYETFNTHHESLGGFSYAHFEILAAGFTNMYGSTQARQYLDNIDPLRNGVLQFMADKGKKILLTAASADEFILADTASLYWDDVKAIMGNGISYRMIPNTNHYMVQHETIPGNTHMHELSGRWSSYAFSGHTYPSVQHSYDWNEDGTVLTITAVYNEAHTGPSHATQLYSSVSMEDDRRDFRIMDGTAFLTYLWKLSQGMSASLAPNRNIAWYPHQMSGVVVNETRDGSIVTVEATIAKPEGKVAAAFFHFRFSCYFDPTQMCETSTPVGFAPRDKVGSSFTCWKDGSCKGTDVV